MSDTNEPQPNPTSSDSTFMKSLKIFLKLLSTTRRQQRISLLKHVSRAQCTHMRSLAYNLMFNSAMNLTPEERKYLSRHSRVIKQIASRRFCLQEKKDLMVDNQILVKRMADIVLPYLKKSEQ